MGPALFREKEAFLFCRPLMTQEVAGLGPQEEAAYFMRMRAVSAGVREFESLHLQFHVGFTLPHISSSRGFKSKHLVKTDPGLSIFHLLSVSFS